MATAQSLSKTAQRAIDAYGGAEKWKTATRVEATIHAHGPLFLWKRPKDLGPIDVKAETARPYVRLYPVDRDGNVGIFDQASARIETPKGTLVEKRENPRQYFPYGRRLFRWDRLDQTYFDGYALWNYFMLPLLLMRDDIQWKETSDGILEARFPPGIHTHCPVQQFRFDRSTGLLARHDFVAEVVGPFTRNSWIVVEHSGLDAVPYVSRKKVTMRGPGNRPLSGPILAELVVHRWHLV